jgi:hypothetical protein
MAAIFQAAIRRSCIPNSKDIVCHIPGPLLLPIQVIVHDSVLTGDTPGFLPIPILYCRGFLQTSRQKPPFHRSRVLRPSAGATLTVGRERGSPAASLRCGSDCVYDLAVMDAEPTPLDIDLNGVVLQYPRFVRTHRSRARYRDNRQDAFRLVTTSTLSASRFTRVLICPGSPPAGKTSARLSRLRVSRRSSPRTTLSSI